MSDISSFDNDCFRPSLMILLMISERNARHQTTAPLSFLSGLRLQHIQYHPKSLQRFFPVSYTALFLSCSPYLASFISNMPDFFKSEIFLRIKNPCRKKQGFFFLLSINSCIFISSFCISVFCCLVIIQHHIISC